MLETSSTTVSPSDKTTDAKPRMEELSGLRGFCVSVVVFHHTLLLWPGVFTYWIRHGHVVPTSLAESVIFRSPLYILAGGGHAAVMFFFVLSGFVLAMPWLYGGGQSYRTFLIRRLSRVYIPYLLVVLSVAGLLCLFTPAPVPGLSAWFQSSWNEPINWQLFFDHLLMLGFNNTLDNPVWSLVWEMRVSLIFPVLMLPLVRWRLAGAVGTAIGLLLLSEASHRLSPDANWPSPPSQTCFYAAFFVLGAVAAMYRERVSAALGRSRLALPLAVLSVALVCNMLPEGRVADTVGGFSSLGMIFATITPGIVQNWLKTWYMRAIGSISYSLYLIHVPMLLLFCHAWGNVAPLPLLAIGAICAAIVLSYLSHRFVEQPCEHLGRRLTARTAPAFRLLGRAVVNSAPATANNIAGA